MNDDVAGVGYGHAFEIATIQQIIDICVGNPSDSGMAYMWRGQADANWLLHSAAYRRLALDGNPHEGTLASYERSLLDAATHRGHRYVDGRELSDFELLARLQHHGAATRLLDATRNVLVALYFTCAELPETDGCLFGVSTNTMAGLDRHVLHGSYDDIVNSLNESFSQTWQAPDVSPRIAAQHSQFLFSRLCNAPHGSIAIAHPSNLVTIRVPASLKSRFLVQLNRGFDINANTLFPDLDGFGSANAPKRHRGFALRW